MVDPPPGAEPSEPAASPAVIDLDAVDTLVGMLAASGHRVHAPVVRDGAIVWGEIGGVGDLPAGWGDEQGPGHYRLRERSDGALFGHAVGPDSPKRHFLPPRSELWRGEVDRREDGTPVQIRTAAPPAPPAPVALVGLKACELAGISVQDRVMLGGQYPDPTYRQRRSGAVLVSVDCGDPAATCFCTSTGTGPVADGRGGEVVPDLRLTELVGPDRHDFVARAHTERGRSLLAALPGRPATAADLVAADEVTDRATTAMVRHLRTDGLADALAAAPDHPRWDEVALRCLSCGNCTQVCPTCFCTTVEDTTDLAGDEVTRTRRWDSCFTLEHSRLHEGPVHAAVRSRYRQWLTHKLSTWWDQFDTSGCVGCGRCVTWCPVGIDLVEEAEAVAGW